MMSINGKLKTRTQSPGHIPQQNNERPSHNRALGYDYC